MPGEIKKLLLKHSLWAPRYPEALESARVLLWRRGWWVPPLNKELIQYHEEKGWMFYIARYEGFEKEEQEVEVEALEAAHEVKRIFRQLGVYMPVYIRLNIHTAWIVAGLGH